MPFSMMGQSVDQLCFFLFKEEVDGFLQAHQLQMEGSFIPRPIQSFDELVVPGLFEMKFTLNIA